MLIMKHGRKKKTGFLGVKIPDWLERSLAIDAEMEGATVSHIARRILLEHYELRKSAQPEVEEVSA